MANVPHSCMNGGCAVWLTAITILASVGKRLRCFRLPCCVCCGPAPSFHDGISAQSGTHGKTYVPGEAQTRNRAAVLFHPRFVWAGSRTQTHTDQQASWSPCQSARTIAILNWYCAQHAVKIARHRCPASCPASWSEPLTQSAR
jgi:hypothetical protein